MTPDKTLTPEDFKAGFPELTLRIKPSGTSGPVFLFESARTITGDFSIDRFNDTQVGTYVFLSDLTVTGNITNWNGDYGIDLLVAGHTIAQNIIAGGSFIHLHSADIPGVVFGHYNHGYIGIDDYTGLLSISQDHHMNLRRTTPHVSLADFPQSAREVYVDDIRLPYNTAWQTQAAAFLNAFRGSPYVEVWTDDPNDMEDAFAEGEYSIDWMSFVVDSVKKGAPAKDDSFARLADRMRRVFQAAASDTDPA